MIEILYLDTAKKKLFWDLFKIFIINVWALQVFVAI